MIRTFMNNLRLSDDFHLVSLRDQSSQLVEGHLNEAKDKRSDNFKMNKKMNEKAGLKRILKRSKHVTYVTVGTISTITISLVIKQN